MKCSTCGLESPLDKLFTRKSFSTRKFICPACQQRGDRRLRIAMLIIWLVLFLPSLALPDRIVANFLFIGLFEVLSVPFHEIGHAIAAWLTGSKVKSIVWGVGRLVVRKQLFNFTVELRFNPIAGKVAAVTPPGPLRRLRAAAHIAGGPLATAILVFIPLSILGFRNLSDPDAWNKRLSPLHALAVANALLLIGSLVPGKIRAYSGLATDGAVLLALFRNAKPVNTSARNAHTALQEKDYQNAALHFRAVLETHAPEPSAERGMAMNNLAWSLLFLNTPEALAEADRYSANAFAWLPWHPAVQSTRGSLLLLTNRIDEGIPLVEKALAQVELPAHIAGCAAFLAIGHARRGNHAKAEQMLQLALASDPSADGVDWAQRELAADNKAVTTNST